jgi:chromosome partitioning protein
MRQMSMPRRISVINLKGGTGKSSLSMNLAHLLALQGYSVVLIDCDMQGNSSSLLSRWEPPTLIHFLRGEAPFPALIRPARDRLAIIPSDRDLNTAATYIASRRHAYYTLRDAVQRLHCDFVIYDHAPSYSPVTEAALLASSEILIPCELAPFSVQAVFAMFGKLEDTLQDHRLVNSGIVPYNVDYRYLMTWKYLKELEQKFGALIAPLVRSDATISRAQSVRQTVWEYDARSRAAKDFAKLAGYLLARQEQWS